MRLRVSLVLTTLAAAACVGPQLNAEESAVRLLRKDDPPASCREVAKLKALGKGGFASDDALAADLKRQARSKGGDTVTWDKQDSPGEGGSVYGTAYACGSK